MGVLPTWFSPYCIVASIVTTLVLFGFSIQTCIYKYNQKDELTQTYSILAVIGLVNISSSCASSYLYTWLVNTANINADWERYSNLVDWMNLTRIIAIFSQMLFLVWRLELTFVHTNYQLSKPGLIVYHIAIIVSIIMAIISTLHSQILDAIYWYIYYTAQLLRLGVFFCVCYQFVNKLLDLIATQHSTNTDHFNTHKLQQHANSKSKLIMDNINNDVNDQLLNQLNDELELAIAIELETGESSFTTRNSTLISIITKLSFLACFDFVTLFVYMTIAEIFSLLYHYHDIKLWKIFFNIYSIVEPLSWIIFSLTVWFSFTFAEKEYLCLFGCCHRRFIKYFEKRAKKRTIKHTMAALSPQLSPIYAQFDSNSKEKSSTSIEILQLQRNVMQD